MRWVSGVKSCVGALEMFRGSECLSSSNASERLSILWSKAGELSSLNS